MEMMMPTLTITDGIDTKEAQIALNLAQRKEIGEFLEQQGYNKFRVGDYDRHNANWQKRSGVEIEDEHETERGYIDIKEWWFDDVRDLRPHLPFIPDSYEVGATFETPHGWMKLDFYGLQADQLKARLGAIEEEICNIQRRLFGKEVYDA